MSLFAKPVANISTDDLQELLVEQAVENIRLEFKRDVPDRDDTLKKLSSFANTFGGLLIVGAEADSKDGRLIALPGVEARASYKQTIVQWCAAGANPPLTVEISEPIPISEGSSRVCYVINTPESDLGPHFLNGRKGVYTRTDEFSNRFEVRLATELELRHLLNRRQLVQERRTRLFQRARERYKTSAAIQPTPEMIGGNFLDSRVELGLGPRFPASPICEHNVLLTS
jgi:predicted HTH transcriptional regulator